MNALPGAPETIRRYLNIECDLEKTSVTYTLALITAPVIPAPRAPRTSVPSAGRAGLPATPAQQTSALSAKAATAAAEPPTPRWARQKKADLFEGYRPRQGACAGSSSYLRPRRTPSLGSDREGPRARAPESGLASFHPRPGRARRPPRAPQVQKLNRAASPEAGAGGAPAQLSAQAASLGARAGPGHRGQAGTKPDPSGGAPRRPSVPASAPQSRRLRAPSKRARPSAARPRGLVAARAAAVRVRRDGKRQEPNPAESA